MPAPDWHGVAKKFPEFTHDDIEAFKQAFEDTDTDKSYSIDTNELGAMLDKIGAKYEKPELANIIKEVDVDKNGTVDWEEFLVVMQGLTKGKSSAFGQHVMKAHKGVNKIVTASGGSHSFSEEEKEAFVDHINSSLETDPLVQHILPIKATDDSLWKRVDDGLLLSALINSAVPDTIDVRALNKPKAGQPLSRFKMIENLNLAINSAKGIGCTVVNVGATELLNGVEHIILGLLWQIIRIGLLSGISLSDHPELYRLLEPGETLESLLKLTPEQILLRWFNYHLKNAGSSRKVNNFSGDIKDSECYTILLNQLVPDKCNKSPMQTSDLTQRADKMLGEADKIGCRKFLKPADVVKGNPKLNLAFVANLFNKYPGLEPLNEEEKSKLDDSLFDSEGSREARAFCLWLNSLGIDPFVNNLFSDLCDGLVILKVMDIVQPGIVDWKRVNQNPNTVFKKVENCNYAVDLGKQMKFSLVGIGGKDIVDGNQKLILGLVWQLMRSHVLSILKKLGNNVNDQFMIDWANNKVKSSGKNSRMNDFKDSSLATSLFFLDLLNAIKPGCVDSDLVTQGFSDDDKMLNAKYTISIARKQGATIFLLPEDIVEVKHKMILTLVGSIMAVAIAQ
jgi:plastin-1